MRLKFHSMSSVSSSLLTNTIQNLSLSTMKFSVFTLSILLTLYQTTYADSFHEHLLLRQELAKKSKSSKLAPSFINPQPGAEYSVEGFTRAFNGYPQNVAVTYPGWPDLIPRDAPNFVNGTAVPVEIKIIADGKKTTVNVPLSRVYDSTGSELGSYWGENTFDRSNDFYGSMAVRYEWNLAQYVVHLRGLETNVTSLKVWKGKVAIQQATLFDENGSIFHDDHWILPGGGTQYWIPQGTFPYINNTNTKWSQKPRGELQLISIDPLTADQIPIGMDYGTYRNLLEALVQLANLLLEITYNSVQGTKAADLLEQSAKTLNQRLQDAVTNADAKAQARQLLWSLVATSRNVDGFFSEAINQAVSVVVTSAYSLAQGPVLVDLEQLFEIIRKVKSSLSRVAVAADCDMYGYTALRPITFMIMEF